MKESIWNDVHASYLKIIDDANYPDEESPRKEDQLTCSICNELITVEASGWGEGHNAEPINDGRCCEACNATVVIPSRAFKLRSGIENG